MKDEIKEILEFDFESQGERIEINEYERNILKDYITTLQEENKELKLLSMTQNNREYRSKFLKEYQKEHGKHCYPDYDEIYKRYDKLKRENSLLKSDIEASQEIISDYKKEEERYKLIIKALEKHFTDLEYYEDNEFLRQLLSVTDNDMVWLKRMAGEENKQ